MRRIEEKMTAAISRRIDWRLDNTSVHYNEEEGFTIVRLYGNKIAEIANDGTITIFDGGVQSNTTKSRLNAILGTFSLSGGTGVFQKSWDWFVRLGDGKGNFTTVPFQSGMTV